MGATFKTFDASGVAPAGRLFAGDLNAIQAMKADSSDFSQTIDLSILRVGDSSLQVVKYGAGEFRLTGAVRTDGILRGLGGMIPGAYTTVARDAIGAGLAPYGLAIINTSTNRYEWNRGTDGARDWQPIGIDPNLPALTPVTVTTAGSKTTGQTYTIAAPVAGTYILEWGCNSITVVSQGNAASITNNVTAGAAVVGGQSNQGTAQAVATGVVLTAGQVITFTLSISGGSTAVDCWAKLTRIV